MDDRLAIKIDNATQFNTIYKQFTDMGIDFTDARIFHNTGRIINNIYRALENRYILIIYSPYTQGIDWVNTSLFIELADGTPLLSYLEDYLNLNIQGFHPNKHLTLDTHENTPNNIQYSWISNNPVHINNTQDTLCIV